jgi:serine/threonine-protein phosphatase 6 regulatory ankyrin repeat subunit B
MRTRSICIVGKLGLTLVIVLAILARVGDAGTIAPLDWELMNAVTRGDLAGAKDWLNKGARASGRDVVEGLTILMCAAGTGKVDILKLLLDNEANVNAKDRFGSTALMFAARQGRAEAVKLLIESGADVTIQDKYGATALMYSAEASDLESVKLLLDRGTAANATDSFGGKALNWAAGQNRSEIMRLLAANGGDIDENMTSPPVQATSLMNRKLLQGAELGAESEDLAEVKAALDRGANVNAKTTTGWTALIYAARMGNREMVKLLIEKGADVNAKRDDGINALMEAAAYGRLEVARLLIDAGADVNAKSPGGMTPLMRASGNRDRLELMKLLVRSGADINARTEAGKTALSFAEKWRLTDQVQYLKARGAQ